MESMVIRDGGTPVVITPSSSGMGVMMNGEFIPAEVLRRLITAHAASHAGTVVALCTVPRTHCACGCSRQA